MITLGGKLFHSELHSTTESCKTSRTFQKNRKETTMKTSIFRLALVGALCSAAMTATAQDIQERTIRFGHLNNTDHPVSAGVQKFAELVSAKSGGKITVKEFPASQLGNEMQQQSALQGGVQEMSAPATTSLVGIVKEFGLFTSRSSSPTT